MCVGGVEKMGNERVYGAVYLRAQKRALQSIKAQVIGLYHNISYRIKKIQWIKTPLCRL